MIRHFIIIAATVLAAPFASADLAGPKEIPVQAPPPPAPIGPFTVQIGEAIAVPISGTIAGVSLGSPNIANVAVHDQHLMFVSGRAYGRTSLHVIDDRGRVIAETSVHVINASNTELVVTRGGADATYDCTPRCRVAPTIGDSDEFFAIATEQAAALSGEE